MRRSRDYCQGVQVQLPENSSDNVVFCFFLVLSLFYSFTESVQWLFKKKTFIFKGFRGGPTFSRGRATFSMGGGGGRGGGGGVQWVISIETHITCDFPGGPHIPPLDPHMRFHNLFLISKGNISCGFPKDPIQEDDSFEHQNKCLAL